MHETLLMVSPHFLWSKGNQTENSALEIEQRYTSLAAAEQSLEYKTIRGIGASWVVSLFLLIKGRGEREQ